jgi:hypothetical protein
LGATVGKSDAGREDVHAQSGDHPTSGIEFRDRDLAIGGDLLEGSTLRIVLGERLRDDGSQGADAGFRAVEWYSDPDTADRAGDPSQAVIEGLRTVDRIGGAFEVAVGGQNCPSEIVVDGA